MSPDLKPIRTRAEHSAALLEIQRLWKAKRNTPDGDRLDVIMTLVEAYEKLHFKLDPPDPIAAIEFRMEQQGLSRADIEPIFGSRGRLSEVLNRRRGLSIEMIRKLNEELGISADVLIQPTVESHGRGSKIVKTVRSETRVQTHKRGGQHLTTPRKAASRRK